MKFYYLRIVDEKMELSAQGGKKLFSGAPGFSLCPARKKLPYLLDRSPSWKTKRSLIYLFTFYNLDFRK
jgi:hypothetical protein